MATRTVDTLFREVETKISFIKCDVNYHELHFVRGALQTIRRWKPSMLLEVGTNPDKSIASKILNILSEEDYDAYYFDGKLLRRRVLGQRTQNWFFLRPSHLALLRKRCPHCLAV